MNLMTGGNQTRHQLPSNRYRRSCHKLKGWVDGPPVIEHLDVVGSYNLFGTQRGNRPFERCDESTGRLTARSHGVRALRRPG
jgi:hypothetical protein